MEYISMNKIRRVTKILVMGDQNDSLSKSVGVYKV